MHCIHIDVSIATVIKLVFKSLPTLDLSQNTQKQIKLLSNYCFEFRIWKNITFENLSHKYGKSLAINTPLFHITWWDTSQTAVVYEVIKYKVMIPYTKAVCEVSHHEIWNIDIQKYLLMRIKYLPEFSMHAFTTMNPKSLWSVLPTHFLIWLWNLFEHWG